MDVWSTGLHGGLLGELERDSLSFQVYESLQRPLIPLIVRNQARGIASNPQIVQEALKGIGKEQEDLVRRAQAYCGWPINIRSPKQLAYWLFQMEGMKVRRKRSA